MSLRAKRVILYVTCLILGIAGDYAFWRLLKVGVNTTLGLDLRLDRIGTMYHIYTAILIGAIFVVILDAIMHTEVLKS